MSGIFFGHHFVPAAAAAGTPTLTDRALGGAGEFSRWKLGSDGNEFADDGDGMGYTDIGDWLSPKVGMSGFEVRATLVSGAVGAGEPLSTWLNLGTARAWKCKSATPSNMNTSAVLTVEIRPVGGLTVDSATISLSGVSGP